MPEPSDMILPMLREMRDEMRAGFAKVDKRFQEVEKRLDQMQETQGHFRQALSADSLLTRLVTGDFEERIAALERRYASIVPGG